MRPLFLFMSEKKTDEGHLKHEGGPEKQLFFGLRGYFNIWNEYDIHLIK